MDIDSVLYQLMDMRTNGILDKIIDADEGYQEISRKSDIYSKQLDDMNLTVEIRSLIDRYVSEENALGARYGALAYLLCFSDCVELMAKPLHLSDVPKNRLKPQNAKTSPQHYFKCRRLVFLSSDIQLHSFRIIQRYPAISLFLVGFQ